MGSTAALAHGRSRSTQDFDVVIDVVIDMVTGVLTVGVRSAYRVAGAWCTDDARELLRLGAERVDRAYVGRWVRVLALHEEWAQVTP